MNIFSVKLATKEEVLDRSQDTGDVNIIWVFTFNSNRDSTLFEFFFVTFLLLVSLIITIIGVFCISRSNSPHRNNRFIVTAGVLSWLELLISRSLVFGFQFSRENENSENSSSHLLFWAALFRYHYMFFGVHSLLCVTAERGMATVFLR
ncbi:CRE-SRE-21 protein [Caenorhabditis remanei]|uniref:CRE-SRE-21 protein n=1 Tax=Caenorhabditis remanei TaxID=31234 RepID=E3NQQ4_CAERE|nr:CRE-SRE-21 protein [Caenorhabditis remanei]